MYRHGRRESKTIKTLPIIFEGRPHMSNGKDEAELDEAFRPLLATKVNPLMKTDGIRTESGLDFKIAVLCEVLELDVDAVAAIDPEERDAVLEEAKRNVGKFPNLNNVQRVDVIRAIVSMRCGHYEECENEFPYNEHAEAHANGNRERASHRRCSSDYVLDADDTLDFWSQWTPAGEGFPSSPSSPLIRQQANEYQDFIRSIALQKLAAELEGDSGDRKLDQRRNR